MAATTEVNVYFSNFFAVSPAALDTFGAFDISLVNDLPLFLDPFLLFNSEITQDPAVMVGKPVVRGTRVPVEHVLQHLADNPDINDVFEAFPHLQMADVQACLAYAQRAVERTRGRARRIPSPTSAGQA